MTPAEWAAAALKVISDLVSGIITHDDAKARMAELAAVDVVVDEAERKKLG